MIKCGGCGEWLKNIDEWSKHIDKCEAYKQRSKREKELRGLAKRIFFGGLEAVEKEIIIDYFETRIDNGDTVIVAKGSNGVLYRLVKRGKVSQC